MTTRRKLLLVLGAGAATLAVPAFAQQEKRVRRIGYLSGSSLQSNAAWLAAFRQGMAELRWTDGRDYLLDARYANGVPQAMASLATELVASQPDLLLTSADTPALLLSQRTKTIPIVFTVIQDPIGSGVAASLQHPGGNATGLANLARDLSGKRLQLLKEAFPRISHVAMLFEPAVAGIKSQVKETQDAAVLLGMRVTPIELRQIADIEAAFKRGPAIGAQAYIVLQGGIQASQRQALVDNSMRLKAPAIYASIELMDAGGLMAYSASQKDNFRRAASYVDKILKGAKPGDLPIEQPRKFELVINKLTAKTMGLTIPQSVLLQATRVIE